MYRSGFVALVGRPNMGKSTLLNALVGQKIAITSPVAQTTRHRIKGVVTIAGRGQIIFLDTPGFSKPLDKLGEYLTDEGKAALTEADIFMMVVDGSQPAGKGDAWMAEQVRVTGKFVLLVINKTDLLKNKPELKAQYKQQYEALFRGYADMKSVTISAKTGKNIASVTDTILRQLPEGPAYYDEDSVTDQRLREMSAELIREKVLLNTREEIPHSVAIGIDRFEEGKGGKNGEKGQRIDIQATLYVDQKSQKGMLIGKDGQMIRKIGTEARKELEDLLETHVYLDLNVKVKQNWRRDTEFLKSLGMALPANG